MIVDARDWLRSNDEMPPRVIGTHFVRYTNGHLSVQVKDFSLSELLGEIAAQSELTVVGQVAPDQRLTLEFHELNLDQALRRILGHRSFILLSGQHTTEQWSASGTLREILWIFPQGHFTGPARPRWCGLRRRERMATSRT